MAVFMVSERRCMLVYHDPSLNIQMRRATPIDRYPSTATSDQPRTRCTFARKQHSKTSPVSLTTPVSPLGKRAPARDHAPDSSGTQCTRACARLLDDERRAALITRATMFRPRPRFFNSILAAREPAVARNRNDVVGRRGLL